MTDDTSRVMIVDPREPTRTALATLLSHEPGLVVAGEAGDVLAAMRAAQDPWIDVVLIDASLAGLGTGPREQALARLSRRTAVVVMGVDDAKFYSRPLQLAGAHGYWQKEASLATLAQVLRAASRAAHLGRPRSNAPGKRVVHHRPAQQRHGQRN